MEFIEPVLLLFNEPKPKTINFDAACALGHVVWNAIVMEQLNPGKNYLTGAKDRGDNVPELNRIIDELAKRKRDLFLSDTRLIGVYDIVKKPDGSYSLWAEVLEESAIN